MPQTPTMGQTPEKTDANLLGSGLGSPPSKDRSKALDHDEDDLMRVDVHVDGGSTQVDENPLFAEESGSPTEVNINLDEKNETAM